MPTLPQAIICDIDGTISDYSKRKHWLDPLGPLRERNDPATNSSVPWDRFNSEAINDAPIAEVIQILRWSKLGTGNTKIFHITGRNDKYRSITRDWINLHRVPSDMLLMRKYGDWRSDVDVKTELYRKHIAGKYNVLFALEDRDKVVEMWRNLGVRCLQVAKGEY